MNKLFVLVYIFLLFAIFQNTFLLSIFEGNVFLSQVVAEM